MAEHDMNPCVPPRQVNHCAQRLHEGHVLCVIRATPTSTSYKKMAHKSSQPGPTPLFQEGLVLKNFLQESTQFYSLFLYPGPRRCLIGPPPALSRVGASFGPHLSTLHPFHAIIKATEVLTFQFRNEFVHHKNKIQFTKKAILICDFNHANCYFNKDIFSLW